MRGKKLHRHCQFCVDNELLDYDNTCCICVAWKPRTIHLPPATMSLIEAKKYLLDTLAYEDKKRETEAVLKLWEEADREVRAVQSDNYIEALNWSRALRHEAYVRQELHNLSVQNANQSLC